MMLTDGRTDGRLATGRNQDAERSANELPALLTGNKLRSLES